MNGISSVLIASSACIVLMLGAIHLFYTFVGTKLHPRDAELKTRLDQAPLMLTRETNMWAAWLGFNASHSVGASLFGALYGYLALMQSDLLFQSGFLLVLGLITLTGYVFLAKFCWFSIPFRGFSLAFVLYGSAIIFEFI